MGKTALLKHTRMYINQYDMSGLQRSIGTLLNNFEKADMTPWDVDVMRSLGDRRETGIEGFGALLDTETGKSADALTEEQSANVSLLIGEGGAPAIGDMAYIVPGIQMNKILNISNNAVGFEGVNFYPEAGSVGAYYINPFGKVLVIEGSHSSTFNSTSVDNGAQTTAGWSAILHVISDSAEWEIKIEHSTNDVDWATLTTFTADGATATSEHKSGSDTVNQYTRVTATRTSGDLNIVVVLCRN